MAKRLCISIRSAYKTLLDNIMIARPELETRAQIVERAIEEYHKQATR